LLLLAVVLAAAAIWINLSPRDVAKPVNLVAVVVARRDIPPYSIIAADEVALSSTSVPETLAAAYHRETEQVIGSMTTRQITAGERIGLGDARPIEQVRYVSDMSLEVVSFPALFSEMVAGQVKPGQRINVYGYREQAGNGDPGEAVLVAANVWVVDVRTSTGEEVRSGSDEPPEASTGLFSAPGLAGFAQPASVVAVAASPDVVRDIVYAFGARGLNAWVSLAPSSDNIPPVAVWPTPTAEPTPAPQPTPTMVAPVSTSLSGAVYMSHQDGGPKVDSFPNNTSVVWAVANLQYTPDGPAPIELTVTSREGVVVFEGRFTHPRSGQESYLIVPIDGFAADTAYRTELKISDKTFAVDWRLAGNSLLPNTGGSDEVG